MPSRPACAAILLFWAYAAGGLLRRDILPDLWKTPPPDLRSVAAAEEDVPADQMGPLRRRGRRRLSSISGRSARP